LRIFRNAEAFFQHVRGVKGGPLGSITVSDLDGTNLVVGDEMYRCLAPWRAAPPDSPTLTLFGAIVISAIRCLEPKQLLIKISFEFLVLPMMRRTREF
jgi:hypothetical protein